MEAVPTFVPNDAPTPDPTWEPGEPAPIGRPEKILRALSRLGQYFTLLAYGLLAFGVMLLGGPGLLFATIGGGSVGTILRILGLVGAVALALLGIYASTVLCR